jgi:uncharacterized protein (DUF1015 family)
MADVRPFRALRYDAARIDPAAAIAPPYDVISPREQAALYARSPHNIVRVEYGETRDSDTASDNRYTRAAADLLDWRGAGVLTRDHEPAIYSYRQEFAWGGKSYSRNTVFAAVRLEKWDKGVIKPHEHTLSGPKADRLELLRATRTQVSPVYCLYRPRGATRPLKLTGQPLYDFDADRQRHVVSAVNDPKPIAAFADLLARSDVYIADGHHRYETALTYRNEARARAASWTGEEPENFVLMALTEATDPGLLVLPTHRLVHRRLTPAVWHAIERWFDVDPMPGGEVLAGLADRREADARFGVLAPDGARMVTLRDRAGVEAAMPAGQPASWRRLDVSVLQYGILAPAFGIDDAALAGGNAVTYTQDAAAAAAAVARGEAQAAFLLNATPVEQVMAVADAGGRMPQKSTYFYPKLPTGLVMNLLDA